VELTHFSNRGFGWFCKDCCGDELSPGKPGAGRARFFSEGEAEEKNPALSFDSLARWRDSEHTILFCTRCGIEEGIQS
jgi:hypothetical protein